MSRTITVVAADVGRHPVGGADAGKAAIGGGRGGFARRASGGQCRCCQYRKFHIRSSAAPASIIAPSAASS